MHTLRMSRQHKQFLAAQRQVLIARVLSMYIQRRIHQHKKGRPTVIGDANLSVEDYEYPNDREETQKLVEETFLLRQHTFAFFSDVFFRLRIRWFAATY